MTTGISRARARQFMVLAMCDRSVGVVYSLDGACFAFQAINTASFPMSASQLIDFLEAVIDRAERM